ncbi:MFS transporter [Acidithrix sp. C25]|uniref:MFS transporter n=1 Tax=Acidithrix sp. C25 TaxID=1671482 RepID=UPI00191B9D2A|nr:MFS transporter [Acidithrix sp. C25]
MNTKSNIQNTSNRSRWLMMPFIALGVAMIIVDATIVNVALPTMIRDLHLNSSDAEWTNSIYSLVFGALLISLGRLGDRFGRRKLFIIGTIIFVLASLLTAAASNSSILLLGRLIQGIGGAMILPSTLSLVNANFFGKDRGIAFAIWGSTIGGVAALGPLLGGWLTQSYSWRWAFLINVPTGIVILVGALLLVPESKDENSGAIGDLVGNLLVILSLGSLVFGLIEAQRYGWWNETSQFQLSSFTWPANTISPIPIALAIFAISAIAFIALEKSNIAKGRPSLIEFSLFSIRSFSAGNIAAAIVSLGEFGILFALPLFLQGARNYTALGTGTILLALALGSFLAGGAVTPLSKKLGARNVVRIGLGLEVIGITSLAVAVSPTRSVLWMVPAFLIYGVGVGFATSQLTGVILAEVPLDKSGLGSGIQSTSRQIGSALGIAILGTVLLSQLASTMTKNLNLLHLTSLGPTAQAGIVRELRASAGAAIPTLSHLYNGTLIHTAAVEAMASATKTAAFTAALFVLIGLFATFLLPKEVDDLS